MTTPSAATARIDTGRWFRQELFLGALLPTALGVSGVIGGIIGATTDPHSITERVVVGILGLLFLAIGGGLYYWLLFATPRSWLDVDATGLTSRSRKGAGWHLDWSEIQSATLIRSRTRTQPRVSNRGGYVAIFLPRYVLRLRVPAETARARPELDLAETMSHRPRKQRDAPVDLLVNLGVAPKTAHEALDALGYRLVPQHIVRERKGELPEELY